MRTINIHAAKTHLSSLVEEAAAGEEIIIAKAGKPMARLIAIEKPAFNRGFRRSSATGGSARIRDRPMSMLLDTHVLIWWLAKDQRLGKQARKTLPGKARGPWSVQHQYGRFL